MKRNIILTLLSEQVRCDEKDSSKQTATGTLEKSDTGCYIIEYTEPDSEMGKSLSRVVVEGCQKAILQRQGLYRAHFIIEQGKTHETIYQTPFGEMKLEIHGKKVNANLTADGGSVYLYYELTSNSQPISENKLIMNIKISQ